ncbi:hypothetical protein GW590_08290 [Rahnella sp. SAP-1]|uniref:Uncharacterized protein n=1 Tax=Rouxiella aceris TaxID=2703884 RepID=A0A848MIA2_9GAMM|nr:hypothetical protein [Rouxiella aceris]NMP26861.1 hypothetical protein [Rouxiella aceris]
MRIIDLDRDNTSYEPGVADRYLKLDGQPDPEWIEHFERAHANFFSMSKRRAQVRGDCIVVSCVLDEIQNQIIELNTQCERATEEWQARKDREKQQKEDNDRKIEAQKIKANQIFGNLKF